MTHYSYTARDRSGRIVSGSFSAGSRDEAAARIRGQGLYITGIHAVPHFLKPLDISWQQGVSRKDLAVFCRLFAAMLDAGLPMNTILTVMIEQTGNKKLREATRFILRRVQEGEPLCRSFGEHRRIFPVVMIRMIEAGELGGMLDNVLERLAVQFEKEYKLNEKIKSALAYPTVVVGMTLLSTGFMLLFVLPVFIRLFATLRLELPLLTRLLLTAGDFVRTYWLLLLLLAAAMLACLAYLAEKPLFRLRIDSLLLRIPILGPLLQKIAIARFSRTLGSLLRGGVPIMQAVEVVKHTAANYAVIHAFNRMQESIRQGAGMAGPLKASGIFPPLVVHMIAIGEETGALEQMLDKIADFYESDVDDMAGRLSSMLEPLLIGFLGILIALIVIAVLLPIMDVVSGVTL